MYIYGQPRLIWKIASLFPRSEDMGHLRELAVAAITENATEPALPAPFRDLGGLTRLLLFRFQIPLGMPIFSPHLTRPHIAFHTVKQQ